MFDDNIIMADIPGIIEGAGEGKGLGLRFLRHIERNSLLLFMIPADAKDIAKEYEILLKELETFNPELLDKGRVIAITKCDMLDEELMEAIKAELPKDIPSVMISSVTGMGVPELKNVLWEILNSEENKITTITHRNLDVNRKRNEEDDFDLELDQFESDDEEEVDGFYYEEDWDE